MNFFWFDTLNSFFFTLPGEQGSDIIDSSFSYESPAFFFIAFFILSVLVFNGFGFFYNSIRSSGILRKNFLLFSIGWFMFCIAAILDALTSPGITLFIVRIVMISSSWFWYFGLKEEHLRPIKTTPEREKSMEKLDVSLIETLLRSKPSEITEEEVTFYREQMICLVCKGKAEGFNIFICPKCNTVYCEECARALSDLENACWACNAPLDASRPSKPYEKEIEEGKIVVEEGVKEKGKSDIKNH